MELDDDIQNARYSEDECVDPKRLGGDESPVPHAQKDGEDKRNEDKEESVDSFASCRGLHRTRRDTAQRTTFGIPCFAFTDQSGSVWDRRTSHVGAYLHEQYRLKEIQLEPDIDADG